MSQYASQPYYVSIDLVMVSFEYETKSWARLLANTHSFNQSTLSHSYVYRFMKNWYIKLHDGHEVTSISAFVAPPFHSILDCFAPYLLIANFRLASILRINSALTRCNQLEEKLASTQRDVMMWIWDTLNVHVNIIITEYTYFIQHSYQQDGDMLCV